MARTRLPSPQTEAVLRALADAGSNWSYGYDICRTLGLKAGTVYPILMRLAERGRVEATWEPDAPAGRPPRHLYRLSAKRASIIEAVPRDGSDRSPGAGRRAAEATP